MKLKKIDAYISNKDADGIKHIYIRSDKYGRIWIKIDLQTYSDVETILDVDYHHVTTLGSFGKDLYKQEESA